MRCRTARAAQSRMATRLRLNAQCTPIDGGRDGLDRVVGSCFRNPLFRYTASYRRKVKPGRQQIVWKDKPIVFGGRPGTRSETILTPATPNMDAQATATTTDCDRVTANLPMVDKWRLRVPDACTACRLIAARHAGPMPPMPTSNVAPLPPTPRFVNRRDESYRRKRSSFSSGDR